MQQIYFSYKTLVPGGQCLHTMFEGDGVDAEGGSQAKDVEAATVEERAAGQPKIGAEDLFVAKFTE
jgi:hypothetical protein